MYVEKKADIAPANSLSCEGKDIDYTRDKQRVFQCLFTVPRTKGASRDVNGHKNQQRMLLCRHAGQ